MKKKIIIIGSLGMLGHVLLKYLKLKRLNVITIDRKNRYSLKIKNRYVLKNFKNIEIYKLIKKLKPTHIINCAGMINHRITKKNLNDVFFINSVFPASLSLLSNKLNYNFIHISTDCVFNGKKGNYVESDLTDGSDFYAQSKILGEYVTERSTVIRSSIIGHELYRKLGLLEWSLKCDKQIKGFNNVYFSGLTTLELSKIIFNYFLKKDLFIGKIVHVSGSKISKFKLLNLINKIYKRNLDIESHFTKKIDKSLNSSFFRRNSGYKLKNWPRFISEMKNFNEKHFKK